MIIKEYRIPLPLTVEEYRIAQLYMIQKKSRNETYGQGSGVEILENRPYTDGPGGSGQYTHKVYHVGMHIPGWFRSILPKAALRVVEESWNAYPYTRTRCVCLKLLGMPSARGTLLTGSTPAPLKVSNPVSYMSPNGPQLVTCRKGKDAPQKCQWRSHRKEMNKGCHLEKFRE